VLRNSARRLFVFLAGYFGCKEKKQRKSVSGQYQATHLLVSLFATRDACTVAEYSAEDKQSFTKYR
jgi:hypothetical protein